MILAGGRGRRMSARKPVAVLGGRPLFTYALAALRAALRDVVVIGKPGLELPGLAASALWIEPPQPRHPLAGIVHALARAGGRPVLTCPVDMPFVTPALIRGLACAAAGSGSAVIAAAGCSAQPLLGRFEPGAAPALARAAIGGLPARAAVLALEPALLQVADPSLLFNVNTPEELAAAELMLTASEQLGEQADRRLTR